MAANNITSKTLVILSGLICLTTPLFASGADPTPIGLVSCGDTPFGKLNSQDYLGSDLLMMCGKTYKKDGIEYIFNKSGQLYTTSKNISAADIPKYIKKYGKPDLDKKTGGELAESRQIGWYGSKRQSVLILSRKTQMQAKLADTTIVSYLCKQTDEPKCDKGELDAQSSKLSEFIKQIVPIWADTKQDMEAQVLVQQITSGLVRHGYPGCSIQDLQINASGKIEGVCCHLGTKDFSLLRAKIFSDIGDIVIGKSETSISLANDRFSLVLTDETAADSQQVSLCFTNNRI